MAGQRNKFKIAVLGAGHGGLAMAGHLALMGHKVNLFNRGAVSYTHLTLPTNREV